jgi:hypothetical protein
MEFKICKNCGKKFYRKGNHSSWILKKFCSNHCRNKWYRESSQGKKTRKNYIEKNRERINKKSLKYYHKHKEKVLEYQINRLEKLKKEDDKIRKKYNLRKIAQLHFSLKGKKCSLCGNDKDLQRHHKDLENNPRDILIVCRKCHNKLHKTLKVGQQK